MKKKYRVSFVLKKLHLSFSEVFDILEEYGFVIRRHSSSYITEEQLDVLADAYSKKWAEKFTIHPPSHRFPILPEFLTDKKSLGFSSGDNLYDLTDKIDRLDWHIDFRPVSSLRERWEKALSESLNQMLFVKRIFKILFKAVKIRRRAFNVQTFFTKIVITLRYYIFPIDEEDYRVAELCASLKY